MKLNHIKTISGHNLQSTVISGGCGECKTSCQSACKTSATVANQSCASGVFKRGEKAPRALSVVNGGLRKDGSQAPGMFAPEGVVQ